jgi:hypothetical protein
MLLGHRLTHQRLQSSKGWCQRVQGNDFERSMHHSLLRLMPPGKRHTDRCHGHLPCLVQVSIVMAVAALAPASVTGRLGHAGR